MGCHPCQVCLDVIGRARRSAPSLASSQRLFLLGTNTCTCTTTHQAVSLCSLTKRGTGSPSTHSVNQLPLTRSFNFARHTCFLLGLPTRFPIGAERRPQRWSRPTPGLKALLRLCLPPRMALRTRLARRTSRRRSSSSPPKSSSLPRPRCRDDRTLPHGTDSTINPSGCL